MDFYASGCANTPISDRVFRKEFMCVLVREKNPIGRESWISSSVFLWCHRYLRLIVVWCSDLGTWRYFLGHIRIGVERTRGPCYRRHRIHTWIKKGRKGFYKKLVEGRSCSITLVLISVFPFAVDFSAMIMQNETGNHLALSVHVIVVLFGVDL